MNVLLQTKEFSEWLHGLRDHVAKVRVVARLSAAEAGNFGECASVGDGVSEMKINVGPGYRVYFTRTGDVIYLLLCGGNKSTQQADIRRAKAMAGQARKR